MPAGVVDVGSNTVRLHIAHAGELVHDERALLGLGDAVERYGSIPDEKLAEVATTVADFVERAHAHGVDQVEVVVTSPGRQAANGAELLEQIERAAHVPVRLLSAADEARFGFAGALSATSIALRRRVGVVDVGGGSAQIAIGSRRDGPTWIKSIDIGSMRLTSRCMPDDPAGPDALRAARAEVARYLEGIEPPRPRVGLAVGGSARALRRVIGSSRLELDSIASAADFLAWTPSAEIAARFDFPLERARTLVAGAVILEAIGRLLGTSFRVVRGGVREGALLELEDRRAAA